MSKTIKTDIATLAGGCFWCVESDFEKLDGVIKAVSGYTGGNTENPSYQDVSAGITGHYEAVQIYYDPDKITYDAILDYFWKHVDPTDPGGQFVDRGGQYKTAIFYHDEKQKKIAEKSKADLDQSGKFLRPVVTEIIKLTRFYRAEAYHQNYYKNAPGHYRSYRTGSGRDHFLSRMWQVSDDQ